MQDDRLHDGRDEHNHGDGKALECTRPVTPSRTRTLMLRDVGKKKTEELGLEERETVLDKFEECGKRVRPSVCDKEGCPQALAA